MARIGGTCRLSQRCWRIGRRLDDAVCVALRCLRCSKLFVGAVVVWRGRIERQIDGVGWLVAGRFAKRVHAGTGNGKMKIQSSAPMKPTVIICVTAWSLSVDIYQSTSRLRWPWIEWEQEQLLHFGSSHCPANPRACMVLDGLTEGL